MTDLEEKIFRSENRTDMEQKQTAGQRERVPEKLKQALRSRLGENRVLADEPMRLHTSFRIGGPADLFVMPSSAEELGEALALCREQKAPYYIIGNGTNLLIADEGWHGVVIQLGKQMSRVTVSGDTVNAQAGALLSSISKEALRASLTGFEFASGIPGTIGGAAVMNAGAYGGELKDVTETVTVMTPDGEVRVLPGDRMQFGYRTSIVAEKAYVVLGAVLRLKEGKEEEIRGRMEELKEKRVSKQPLDLPSAGSTFKRPEGNFAGKLIMEAGLSGFCVGGAMVSPKHCGFVVNKGGASAADVCELMKQIRERVYQSSGVLLEPEVKMLGIGL